MSDSKPTALDRGRDAVQAALIAAARELLATVGPNAMSVRSVAARAGVNHGQVQHYFGGKQGLIDAAVREMAQEHFDNAHQRAGGDALPPALTLSEDAQYLRSIVRLVLDGQLDTALQEVDDGISIPVEVRNHFTKNLKKRDVPPELKARLALTFAVELGWAALQPYVMEMAGVTEQESADVRASARVLARTFLDDLAP